MIEPYLRRLAIRSRSKPRLRAGLTWIELVVTLAIIVLILVAMDAGFLDEDELIGLTPDEVRAQCGAPDGIYDHRNRPGVNQLEWVYGHWMPWCYSRVLFKNDVVVSVSQVTK